MLVKTLELNANKIEIFISKNEIKEILKVRLRKEFKLNFIIFM